MLYLLRNKLETPTEKRSGTWECLLVRLLVFQYSELVKAFCFNIVE